MTSTSTIEACNRDPDNVSRIGLFADPAGYVDGASLYEYCESGPLNALDPAGTDDRGDYYRKLGKAKALARRAIQEKAALQKAQRTLANEKEFARTRAKYSEFDCLPDAKMDALQKQVDAAQGALARTVKAFHDAGLDDFDLSGAANFGRKPDPYSIGLPGAISWVTAEAYLPDDRPLESDLAPAVIAGGLMAKSLEAGGALIERLLPSAGTRAEAIAAEAVVGAAGVQLTANGITAAEEQGVYALRGLAMELDASITAAYSTALQLSADAAGFTDEALIQIYSDQVELWLSHAQELEVHLNSITQMLSRWLPELY